MSTAAKIDTGATGLAPASAVLISEHSDRRYTHALADGFDARCGATLSRVYRSEERGEPTCGSCRRIVRQEAKRIEARRRARLTLAGKAVRHG